MLALIATTAALAATPSHDVPELLARQIDRAHDRGAPRVLLPARIRADVKRLYATGRVRRRSYAMHLGTIRGCSGATACGVAAFYAERRGERLPGGRRVKLARGRIGRFWPMACGASCSKPQIQWRERKVLYTMEAPVKGRRAMKRLADNAIRNGAR